MLRSAQQLAQHQHERDLLITFMRSGTHRILVSVASDATYTSVRCFRTSGSPSGSAYYVLNVVRASNVEVLAPEHCRKVSVERCRHSANSTFVRTVALASSAPGQLPADARTDVSMRWFSMNQRIDADGAHVPVCRHRNMH